MRTENNQFRIKKGNLDSNNYLKYFNDEKIYLIAILTLAIFLRFWNLGYSEFQGDEARAIVKSAEMILGSRYIIFEHRKGPTELLLQIPYILFFGQIDEFICRFSYASVGIVCILAIYIIAKKLFDKKVALLSALLLSICGFFVGFSRIVQYQSMVILATELSLFFLIFFYTSTNGQESKYLILTSFFYSLSLLSHYESIFFLPVLLYLVYMKYGQSMLRRKEVLYAVVIVISISLAFYIPFVLNPNFRNTLGYLRKKTGITQEEFPLYFNLESFLQFTTLYTSYYFTILLAVATLYIIFIYISRKNRIWQFELILLWFLSFLIPYLFFIKRPYSHFYLIYPPWIIMTSLGISKFQESFLNFKQNISKEFSKTIRSKKFSRALGKAVLVIFALLIILSNYYVIIAFLQHEKDPSEYPLIYHNRPRAGIFGFPHKSGWKAAGWYIRENSFPGDEFFTNEDKEITRYYLGLDTADLNSARFILLVPDPWDPDKNDLDEYFSYAEKNCALVAIVEIKGEKSIFIYDKGPIGQNTEILYAEEYETKFDEKYGTPQKILGSYL